MIYYISRKEHQYTIKDIQKTASITAIDYDTLFKQSFLPRASYIFADLDRLHPWDRELAAAMYQNLKEAGARVMNNPARALLRYDLLKRLKKEGINNFDAFRLSTGEEPSRYPVFLRRDTFHEGVFTDLINTPEELHAAHERLISECKPATNLLAVEYAAEKEQQGDYFKKMSVYRVGDHYFRDTSVIQRTWEVKYGENGLAEESYFENELKEINTVPYESTVRRAFEIASIEYGRLDLGFYEGQPQVYEINTNPTISSLSKNSPSPARDQSRAAFQKNFLNAMNALQADSDGAKISITNRTLKRRRRKSKWFQQSYPTI
tara:strand:- start:326 stop:1285 length:960 start_codon:yes stop_codon:yes gene_type:complete